MRAAGCSTLGGAGLSCHLQLGPFPTPLKLWSILTASGTLPWIRTPCLQHARTHAGAVAWAGAQADSHASGLLLTAIPPPLSRQVYKPLIPSYKRCCWCQGSSGACCHSHGWNAAPASVCGYRTSCSGLGADGGMAHLTGSRPSKDEGGGRVCMQRGKPQSPATQRWSQRTHPSFSPTPQITRRKLHARVNLERSKFVHFSHLSQNALCLS